MPKGRLLLLTQVARRHRHCCDVFGVNGIARFIVDALRDLALVEPDVFAL